MYKIGQEDWKEEKKEPAQTLKLCPYCIKCIKQLSACLRDSTPWPFYSYHLHPVLLPSS